MFFYNNVKRLKWINNNIFSGKKSSCLKFYGFGKKVAKIKPQRLFELAYIYRCDIKEELKFLRQNKVVACNFEYCEISINKNYDEWKIPYHKLFKEDDLKKLKKVNIETKELEKKIWSS